MKVHEFYNNDVCLYSRFILIRVPIDEQHDKKKSKKSKTDFKQDIGFYDELGVD